MEFEEFREKIAEGLQEIYGNSAEINTGMVIKNNGSRYNGVSIILKDAVCRAVPVIELDSMYAAFASGRLSLGACIWEVYRSRESFRNPEEVELLAEKAKEWERVKYKIYPILLSTEENKELLEDLVSTPMLDLSVAYVIRGELAGEYTASIKITQELLETYGVSVGQLHMQAVGNMEMDGYEFQDLKDLVMRRFPTEVTVEERGENNKTEIYILTNSANLYGAAGILNRKLLREFAGNRDFIILPSSIHETIFIPVTNETDQKFFDEMVSEVNRTQVSLEERLADHSYYYDAAIGEIRMCA